MVGGPLGIKCKEETLTECIDTEALTPEERNKIMGHRQGDSRVYVQYYMSNFNDADCQSICFGSAPQRDLVHLAGRLLRHGDAPTALTDNQRFEVSQDPKLIKCRQKRSKALEAMKSQGYSTRAAAEGTRLAAQYDYYKKKADSLNKMLKSERLQQAIKDFHDSIHIEEINRQLNGVKPSKVIAPLTINYELPERAQVARLFSQATDVLTREALYPLRMSLVKAMAQLCRRRESPCRPHMRRSRKAETPKLSTNEIPKPSIQGSENSLPFCPFCKWADDQVGESQREKPWRIDSLARHLRTKHLRRRQTPFDCPYNGCPEVLGGPEHFVSHTERQHGLHLPPAVL